MTRITAIVVAIAFIINDFTLFYSDRFLESKYLGPNLMYLISMTLLLRELEVFPVAMWARCFPLCLVLEVPISQTIIEVSLIVLWRRLQDIVAANAEGMLKKILQDRGLEWLFCHLCCGDQNNCSVVFTEYVMKFVGFVMLLTVCAFLKAK